MSSISGNIEARLIHEPGWGIEARGSSAFHRGFTLPSRLHEQVAPFDTLHNHNHNGGTKRLDT